MGYMAELLEVSENQALEFFFKAIISEEYPEGSSKLEIKYIASIMAHYTQVSTVSSSHFPMSRNLGQIFDEFVLNTSVHTNPEIMEWAGAQTVILAGFFGSQMSRRNNLPYFEEVGRSFYIRASLFTKVKAKKELFERVSSHYPDWTKTLNSLSKTLRDNRYLIRLEN